MTSKAARKTNARASLLLATCVAVLALAGCGDDEQDGGAAGGAGTERYASVEIKGLKFRPAEIEVKTGQGITWTNRERRVNHTVTKRSGPGEAPDSGNVGWGGDTYTDFFPEPGRIEYFCRYHPKMRGTVIVK